VANLVAQKTREIGIRIALGSSVRQAMVHIGSPGMNAAILGFLLGSILCIAALRTMHSVLYGIAVYDVPTLIAVTATLIAVTLLATTVPTLRITRIDPATTLREE
jgi:ABC-type lipoprotein release transport system permease subunit